MQFTGTFLGVSPLATGHPLGLPAVQQKTLVDTKVQPVAQQSKTENDTGREGLPPKEFWRSLTGSPDPATHTAPPSIMQLKILAILDEQAERLDPATAKDGDPAAGTEAPDPAEPPDPDTAATAAAPGTTPGKADPVPATGPKGAEGYRTLERVSPRTGAQETP
ncbi:hypothetical protein [Salipiger sp.]|uniref:hypothetical protein n=1 Tax=Salipiger sp. TaxID=2078585 RepID=UPI003A985424